MQASRSVLQNQSCELWPLDPSNATSENHATTIADSFCCDQKLSSCRSPRNASEGTETDQPIKHKPFISWTPAQISQRKCLMMVLVAWLHGNDGIGELGATPRASAGLRLQTRSVYSLWLYVMKRTEGSFDRRKFFGPARILTLVGLEVPLDPWTDSEADAGLALSGSRKACLYALHLEAEPERNGERRKAGICIQIQTNDQSARTQCSRYALYLAPNVYP